MSTKRPEISTGKILSTFFTNLGIAWFSAGVIAPFFTADFYPFSFLIIGLSGSLLTVIFAIMLKDIK